MNQMGEIDKYMCLVEVVLRAAKQKQRQLQPRRWLQQGIRRTF